MGIIIPTFATGVKNKYYNKMQSNQKYIEQFHLLFLDHLGRKLDKRLYALKGGCNLRFYFKSMRYSEDIDFDAQVIRKETLHKNVQNILESKQFQQILKTRNINIGNISSPKQTETMHKSGWFAATPELELPPQFNRTLCQQWVNKIPNPRRKTLVANKFASILQTYG